MIRDNRHHNNIMDGNSTHTLVHSLTTYTPSINELNTKAIDVFPGIQRSRYNIRYSCCCNGRVAVTAFRTPSEFQKHIRQNVHNLYLNNLTSQIRTKSIERRVTRNVDRTIRREFAERLSGILLSQDRLIQENIIQYDRIADEASAPRWQDRGNN